MKREILNNILLFGCTIVSDGCYNVQRRPLTNIMIISPRGEMFFHAIDSTGSIKSRPYIADVISSIIDEVGASNVIQVVMDNAKELQAGRQNLEAMIS